jgi:hypothetical protein
MPFPNFLLHYVTAMGDGRAVGQRVPLVLQTASIPQTPAERIASHAEDVLALCQAVGGTLPARKLRVYMLHDRLSLYPSILKGTYSYGFEMQHPR